MPTRTRTRTTLSTVAPNILYQRRAVTNGGKPSSWLTIATFGSYGFTPNSSDVITDESGKFTTDVRPCNHTTSRSQYFPLYPTIRPRKVTNSGGTSDYEFRSPPIEVRILNSSLTIPLPTFSSERTSFIDSVARSATEHIPVEVSVPNFLLELRDIPGTIKTLATLQDIGPETLKELRSAVRGKKVRLGKTTADHWLNFNFGVLPLISDITSFCKLHDSVQKRIAYLKRTRNKPTKFRRHRSFTASYLSPWVDWYPIPTIAKIQYQHWTKMTYDVTAGGTILNQLEGLDDVNRHLLSYASAAGFTKPLSVIWEAVPYSFLVDYFTNVGDLINSLSMPVFDGSITVSNGFTGTKKTTVTEIYSRFFPSYPTSYSGDAEKTITSPVLTQRNTSVNYVRDKGLATSRGLTLSSNLTWNQYANVLALLV